MSLRQSGEIFLLIGQSNMVGRGVVEVQDRQPVPRVFALNRDLQWQPAADPLHWDNANAGVGMGCSFARRLARENPAVQIGLVPAAAGGALSINEQLALTPVSIYPVAFVSSAGLGHIGDELHFNAESQREFGRRYALAFLGLDPEWSATGP